MLGPVLHGMFGTYRFILALAVAIGHLQIGLLPAFTGRHAGQMAVMGFYLLSGYLMDRQCRRLGTRAFCLDRFLRIYPLYLLILTAAWFCFYRSTLTWGEAAANLALLPMNYQDFFSFTKLIGPAFSLACEVHFYLLVPWLVGRPLAVIRGLYFASLLIHGIVPICSHERYWCYEGLPGTFFVFLTGMLISRGDLRFTLSLPLVLLAWFFYWKGMDATYSATLYSGIYGNVTYGAILGYVAVLALRRGSPQQAWDRFLGRLSYPLFISHMLVFDLGSVYLQLEKWQNILLAITVAGILAWLVEIPLARWRYALRQPGKLGT
ncbi:MAG TPA: acyltransferase [Verrucomicrobiae bacterium]